MELASTKKLNSSWTRKETSSSDNSYKITTFYAPKAHLIREISCMVPLIADRNTLFEVMVTAGQEQKLCYKINGWDDLVQEVNDLQNKIKDSKNTEIPKATLKEIYKAFGFRFDLQKSPTLFTSCIKMLLQDEEYVKMLVKKQKEGLTAKENKKEISQEKQLQPWEEIILKQREDKRLKALNKGFFQTFSAP